MLRAGVCFALAGASLVFYSGQHWIEGILLNLAGFFVILPELREKPERRFYSQRSRRFPSAGELISDIRQRAGHLEETE